LEISKESSALFARDKRPHVDIQKNRISAYVGYSDSDYARDDRKSTSRYVFTLARGVISWKSCKQTVTTSSTMYAKFVACYEATG
jgi:hypothetical protein